MEINGKTTVLGLIGDPVEHTFSPAIHNGLTGLDTVYVPFHVKGEGLEAAIKGAYELGIRGLNVTVPHKSAVIPYLSSIDPMAKAIGAVNTLVREDGGYRGYNTDLEGFERELGFFGIDVEGRTAVMLGAGGASRAVAFALARMGAQRVHIFNRTYDKALAVAASVNDYFHREVMIPDTYEDIDRLYGQKYIAVQCTSVGLYPETEKCVINDERFFEGVTAGIDIIYKPSRTRFMQQVEAKGGLACNGLRMLLYQGAAAYEKFMDTTVSEEELGRAALRLKAAAGLDRSRILVGYMGSGKTTVAKLLGEKYGLKVIDSDAEIEKEQGRSINRIFAEDGEGTFRDMETAFLRKLAGLDEGFVLATGGGMPVREENRRLMLEEMYASVIYLRAGADTLCERLLGDETRPLLKPERQDVGTDGRADVSVWQGSIDRGQDVGTDGQADVSTWQGSIDRGQDVGSGDQSAGGAFDRGAGDGRRAELFARIESMLRERGPVYEECADICIDTDELSPEEIAARL